MFPRIVAHARQSVLPRINTYPFGQNVKKAPPSTKRSSPFPHFLKLVGKPVSIANLLITFKLQLKLSLFRKVVSLPFTRFHLFLECVICSLNFCPIAALLVNVVNFPGTTKAILLPSGPVVSTIMKLSGRA